MADQYGYDEDEILKELGFSSLLEFILHHWEKLPERSQTRLKNAGIFPDDSKLIAKEKFK